MRAIWKGHIRFSLVTIPVRIYNAVDTEQTIRFNQLHKEDHGPIGYDKKCKKCNKVVTNEEIVKGYPYETWSRESTATAATSWKSQPSGRRAQSGIRR